MKASLLVIFILASVPGYSWACGPVPPSGSMARDAAAVYIGKAITSRWLPDTPHLLVRVAITEVLRGRPTNTLEAVSPCGLPIRDGERVVVVDTGKHLLAYPADMYEKVARAGVRGGR